MLFMVIGVPLLLALLGGLLAPWLIEFFAVDSCLDAGGEFDYAAQRCVQANAAP